MILTAVVTVIAAYFIGSVNFAVIFTKIFTKNDIRDFGSGNAGATNVLRVGGVLPGILTFVCDALKGFLACFMGKLMFDYMLTSGNGSWSYPIIGAYMCGVACMLGHVFPLFFGFKGGKGVAISVGIYAVCCPVAIVIGLLAFALVTIISKTVSLGSLVATVTVVSLSIALYTKTAPFWPQAVLSVIMGIIIFIKHKSNIKRLIAGEENKFNIRR